jgi:hypothetical protein
MLTGLELYYLERAGYFVRRGALTGALLAACREAAERITEKGQGGESAEQWYAILHPDLNEPALIEALAHPQIIGVPEDLYRDHAACWQAEILYHSPGKGFGSAWHRDLRSDLDASPEAQLAHLERYMQNIRINAALRADETLRVIPGTHATPPLPEQRDLLKKDPCAALPGQVRIRLEPGDVLFYNGNLLHREEIAGEETRLTLHAVFVSRLQPPAQRETPAWLSEPAFLESLPPRLRPMMERFARQEHC